LVESVSATNEIQALLEPESNIHTALAFTADQSAELASELNELLSTSKPFLNPEVSLRLLAKELNINSNKLSKFINDHLQTNFNELINTHRLDHFKDIALKPENKHLTILGLAYDSGFNSKTVFNTFFKKIEGITPKAWLKSKLQ
jgi:AraC-like DNA-binding protein